MTTNTTSNTADTGGLTIEKIKRARELLDKAAPYPDPDHLAARQETIDIIAKSFKPVEPVTYLGSFYGLRIVGDESVALGCVEMRDKDGNVLAICGGFV